MNKSQKIRDEIHKALKKLAAEEGRSLQDVTEELLEHGLQERGITFDEGTDGPDGNTGGSQRH